MLTSLKKIARFRLEATDGLIGRVDDILFCDREWTIRYLVADTGNWLPGKLVLIAPHSFGRPEADSHAFPIRLSKKQIENSPSINADQPVYLQHQQELHRYYGWPEYWPVSGFAGPTEVPEPEAEIEPPDERPDRTIHGDPHLRSFHEVTGYRIHAADGEIGHLEDALVDEAQWIVRYLVVDTRNWLPGRKVILLPAFIKNIDWDRHFLETDLTSGRIKDGPEYDPGAPLDREFEVRLHDFYGHPRYWG